MITDHLDPFAAGGRETDDANADREILAIFRRWVAAENAIPRDVPSELVAEGCERATAVALPIADMPAAGIAGLAVKAYLVSYGFVSEFEESLLDDLARFVPEIAELIAGYAIGIPALEPGSDPVLDAAALEAAPTSACGGSAWPISTAPTVWRAPFGPCLLYPAPGSDREWTLGRWNGEGWCDNEGLMFRPLAWAPLPVPPIA